MLFDQQELFSEREITEVYQPNEMIKVFGSGPSDARCQQCIHLECVELRGYKVHKIHKCIKRSRQQEHQPRWQACGKFEAVDV